MPMCSMCEISIDFVFRLYLVFVTHIRQATQRGCEQGPTSVRKSSEKNRYGNQKMVNFNKSLKRNAGESMRKIGKKPFDRAILRGLALIPSVYLTDFVQKPAVHAAAFRVVPPPPFAEVPAHIHDVYAQHTP